MYEFGESFKFQINIFCLLGDSANAVPHYQKLRIRVAHIWGDRGFQPNRKSAMERPRPGETAKVTTVFPMPGKYELVESSTTCIYKYSNDIMVF